MTQTTLPLDELLPHKEPMRVLGSAQVLEEEHAQGTAQLKPGHLWSDAADTLLPGVMVEVIAQLEAARSAQIAHRKGKRPLVGMLVGVQDFVWHKVVPAEAMLHVAARVAFQIEGASLVAGEVHDDNGQCLAKGTLKLWEGRDWPRPETTNMPPRGVPGCMGDALDFLHEDDGVFELPPGFPGFAGHFPGRPMMPGVALIEMARVVARHKDIDGLLRKMQRLKIYRPLGPGASLQVTLEPKGTGWKMAATSGDAKIASALMEWA